MWIWKICVPAVLAVLLADLVASDGGHHRGGRHGRHGRGGRRSGRGRGGRSGFGRQGRQDNAVEDEVVPGGVDFSDCEMQDDGMCCVFKEEETTTLQKDPLLECNHKEVEKCHYTYVTEFTPAQEEVCEENFEKKCQITFKQMAVTETVQKCYRPLMKKCGNEVSRVKRQLQEYGNGQQFDDSLADGQAPEECKTFYESSCTTRYVEKQPGKFVGDTKCEKLPIELCGQGCVVEEGEEECHDKEVDTLIDVPEEVCDLNPQKTCRFQTKLVPKLKPTHECTIIPQQICTLKFSNPRQETVPFMSKWCIDPAAEIEPDQTYDESDAEGEALGPEDDSGALADPSTLYGAPPGDALDEYGNGADYSDYDENDYTDNYDDALSNDLPPPPPPAAEYGNAAADPDSFEQAESSYNRLNTAIPVIFSPVQSAAPGGYSAAAPAAGGYDGPAAGAAPLGEYEQPADAAAAAIEQARSSFRSGRTRSGFSRQGRRNGLRSFGRTGRRNNGGRSGRRNNRRGNQRNQRNRSGRARSFSRRGRQEVTVPAPAGPETLYGAPAPPPADTAIAEYGAATAPLPSYGAAPAGYGAPVTDELPSYGIGNRRSSASNVVPVYVPRSGRAQYYLY